MKRVLRAVCCGDTLLISMLTQYFIAASLQELIMMTVLRLVAQLCVPASKAGSVEVGVASSFRVTLEGLAQRATSRRYIRNVRGISPRIFITMLTKAIAMRMGAISPSSEAVYFWRGGSDESARTRRRSEEREEP
jgi:hypothetical protein